jgi:selenium metabolism protein YedF
MSPHIVDARHQPCPQPVILTRRAMREAQEIIVLLSSEESLGNVSRLAEKAGWQVALTREGDTLRLRLTPPSQIPAAAPEPVAATAPTGPLKIVVLMRSERIGEGDPELGGILARAFFHTLTEADRLPDTIVLYNSGVRLAVTGSSVLEDLRTLVEAGVEVLCCGTCLKYYELTEQLGVGLISNMYTIAETLLGADRLITP